MITLRKNEQIEIYQIELALKEKTKRSPFIAVLILAKEQSNITAESLQQNLLPPLPLRACENLLQRLSQQGYLKERCSSYTLTDIGKQSATDKSFWVGEKGVYNVYIGHSKLLTQKIIQIEKVKRSGNGRNGSQVSDTPCFISEYKNKVLKINEKEIRIEDIEKKCFRLKPQECFFEIEAKDDASLLKILKEKQTLFETSFDTNETDLKEELLQSSKEFNYDKDKQAILSEFNPENISFQRKVEIKKTVFKSNRFNPIEIDNVSFIPSDKWNADRWYEELLFKNTNKYFLDESSYKEFADEMANPILQHYKITIPERSKLIEMYSKRENAFYQTAKLETIDYLNY
jgi:hypothetical protein